MNNKVKQIIYIGNLLFILFSCKDSGKFTLEKVWDDKMVAIRAQVVNLDKEILLSRDIQIVDSILIIHNNDETPPVYQMYKISNENEISYISGFGTIGDGPCEFRWNTSIQRDKNTLAIFDKSLLRYYLINQDSLLKNNSQVSIETEFVRNASSFNRIIKVKENLFFGTGYFPRGRFSFYQNDSVIYTNLPYPDDDIGVGNEQKGMIYQGCLEKLPGGNRFVYAGFYGHVFEIYELENDMSIKKIFSDIYEFPRYIPNNSPNYSTANYAKDNIIGFFTVSVTQEYIYALFCGKHYFDKKTDCGNIVYVYDWNGQRVKKYILDKDIVGMCVDNRNQKMYTLCMDDENLKIACYCL